MIKGKCLLIIALFVTLAACEKKPDSPTPAPVAAPNMPKRTPSPTTQSIFSYDYTVNGCDTGKHESNTVAELCEQLRDDQLNNGCAQDFRKMDYADASCGEWDQPAQPRPSATPVVIPVATPSSPRLPGSSPATTPILSPVTPVATPAPNVPAEGSCLEFAFAAYDRQFQGGTAMDKAVVTCDQLANADLPMVKFIFAAYDRQFQSGVAMDKTAAAAVRLPPDALPRLKVLFNGYEQQFQSGTAMDKAIAQIVR
jgi:hypothetical protein